MRRAAPVFRSRLARRVFLLFVIGALVPILVTSLVSYAHTRSILRDQQAARLRDFSQTYALAVLQRIETAQAAISLAQDAGPGALRSVAERPDWAPFVRTVAVYRPDNRWESLRGSGVFPLPTADVEPWLASGRTWMTMTMRRNADGGANIVLVDRPRGRGDSLVYHELDAQYVFGNAQQLPYATGIQVATDSGVRLYQVQAGEEHPGEADETSSASWELLLKPRFATEPWIVTASEHRDVDGSPATLTFFFPLGLVAAVLLVLLLSATQIRRILVPLEALLEATRRVAQRNFEAHVTIRSGDEFEELAHSFNRMSDSLRQQFAALQALSEIDRLIVASPEVESILQSLLRHVRTVAGCKCASVILMDADEQQHGRIYIDDGTDAKDQPVLRVAFDPAVDAPRVIEGGMLLELSPGAVPPAYAAHLVERDVRWAVVHPARGKGGLVAILALGYETAPDESSGHRDFTRDFADRLAVALTNFEREEQLYTQAHYDELTGLPNRQLLKQRLAQEVALADGAGELTALLYVDLDNFKRVNDTLGHGAGDELLNVVARRLVSCTKQSDTVARLGGDEFVMIVPRLSTPDLAMRIAERVLAQLGEPLTIGAREYHVRASIGIAICPTDGNSIEELLKNADTAMYRAKEDGRGRITYFEPHMNAKAIERWALETGLHRALQARQFVLHYQPQFNLHTGAMSGAEALIRWQCPIKGQRPPAEFIPAAEETGLIVDIGAWALSEACEQYKRWRAEGITVPQLAINVCADQLRQANFVQQVKEALLHADMPPWALELEITESVLLTDDPRTAQCLHALVALGVKLALDDFGTGYSSMSYLRRHPVHVIKVDRSFISDIPENPEAAAIATAIVAMARSLRKQTVAEGVETAAQLEFLKSLGCDSAQGYFFAKPVPADQLSRFVSDHRRRVEETIRMPAMKMSRAGRG
jgi:diguanylate cyclase (GGDEF)-like protein